MSEVVTHIEKPVARPLHILVPLIKADLEEAQKAGMPYFRAAGEKMIEAKGQIRHGGFERWIEKNFQVTPRYAREWMNLARSTPDPENGIAIPFSSIRETVQHTRDNPNYGKPASWRADMMENIRRASEAAERWDAEELSRQEERDAERKLALLVIDTGFKALASKLHPDKGGSRDAMARLNRVRDRLKQHA